ncbi:MAG TPA: SCO family protein [Gammaproteobacteria bacterium]|nr:SCO family protein [Gammaproteobacteria bacterium]
MTEPMSKRALTRQRLTLIGIALLFLSPMLAAWITWHYMQRHGVTSTVNHGELVSPAHPLTAFSLRDIKGNVFTLGDLRGKWNLVYLGGNDCDAGCRKVLYKMRQARLAQGGEMRRVRRIYIMSAPGGPAPGLVRALDEFTGTTALTGTAAALASVRAQFEQAAPQPSDARTGWLYIVDPIGNIMMRYAPGFAGPGLVKDLERLLRVSQVG